MYRDLHLHLSGATDPVVLYELICEAGLKYKKSFEEFKRSITMDKVNSLDSYLEVIHSIDKAQSWPAAIEKSVYNAFVSSYLGGTSYLELRWNPYKRSRNFSIDFDRLITAAIAGMERAKSYFGIQGAMIFCLGRDCKEHENKAIFRKAVQYKRQGIIGIDLAGPENGSSLEFSDFFAEAKKEGLITTIHCGETTSADYDELRKIITDIKPDRIGHGIAIIKNPDLLEMAKKANCEFEICPSSNLSTKVLQNIDDLGSVIQRLTEEQVTYHICTDSTFPLQTTIKNEYETVNKVLNKRYVK
jgi:adenosine deaminase